MFARYKTCYITTLYTYTTNGVGWVSGKGAHINITQITFAAEIKRPAFHASNAGVLLAQFPNKLRKCANEAFHFVSYRFVESVDGKLVNL